MDQDLQTYAQDAKTIITELVISYAPKVLGAILLLIFGMWVINRIVKGVKNRLSKQKVDKAIVSFSGGITKAVLVISLLLSVLGLLGIAMTSFIAILGAVGLAIGMALSGTLQNFAGGVVIIVLRPFGIGDYIDCAGHQGVVHDLGIFNTILLTVDNKKVIIPNGQISTNSVVNYSAQNTRRVDFTFGVAYGSAMAKVRPVILDVITNHEKVLKTPAPNIFLGEMADSSVNIITRVWCKTEDYWDVFFDINEAIYTRFNEEGIEIPFPQMDVHLDK